MPSTPVRVPTLVYDGDCGFCTSSTALDRAAMGRVDRGGAVAAVRCRRSTGAGIDRGGSRAVGVVDRAGPGAGGRSPRDRPLAAGDARMDPVARRGARGAATAVGQCRAVPGGREEPQSAAGWHAGLQGAVATRARRQRCAVGCARRTGHGTRRAERTTREPQGDDQRQEHDGLRGDRLRRAARRRSRW